MEIFKQNWVKFLLVNILIFGTALQVSAGGPWVKKKKTYYLKLSEWWTVFDAHYTDRGLIDPNVTTGIFNTALYAEYGISDRFTGIFNGNLFSRNYMNNLRSGTTNEILVPGEAINSIGDIDLGIKYGLTKSNAPFPIAVSLVLGLPTGKIGGGSQENLQTGDGEFNQLIQFDIGKGIRIKNLDAYVSAYTAFNNRTRGFSEEFRYGGEIGIGALDRRLWLVAKLNAVESLKNGAASDPTSGSSIFANNTEFVSWAVEANVFVTKRLGFSLGYASAFSGSVIAAAPSYNVGVFFDFK